MSLRGETYIGFTTTVGVGPLSERQLNSSRLRHAEIQKIEYPMSVHDKLVESVKTLGFKWLSTDTGIFIHQATNGDFVIMVAYVDDVLFIGPNRKLVISKKEEFKLIWEC